MLDFGGARMQLANEVVTYYHLEHGHAKSGIALIGSWYIKSIASADRNGVTIGQSVQCRVPVENAPEGFVPCDMDMLVRGSCDAADVTDTQLRRDCGAVTIQAVHDNRRGHMPHWKLEAV